MSSIPFPLHPIPDEIYPNDRRDAEMVDSPVSKTGGFTSVRVRLPLSALIDQLVSKFSLRTKIAFFPDPFH